MRFCQNLVIAEASQFFESAIGISTPKGIQCDSQNNFYVIGRTEEEKRLVHNGDWILIMPWGELQVMGMEEFGYRYCPLKDGQLSGLQFVKVSGGY